MGRLGRATCTEPLISAPDQPGRKRMYHYKREAKRLPSKYIYCDLEAQILDDKYNSTLVPSYIFFSLGAYSDEI